MPNRPLRGESPQRPAQSQSSPSDLRVRAFVLSRERNAPFAGQPVAIIGRDPAGADRVAAVLSTNRIGYVSFRIPASRLANLSDLRIGLLGSDQLLPLANGGKEISSETAQSALLLTIKGAPEAQSAAAQGLPSFTDPDALDFHLSPGSFSSDQDLLVGEDGKGIVPADLAARQFTLIKPVRERGPGQVLNGEERRDPPLEIRNGFLLVFDQVWSPKGHALGDIVRSVPLAPGEASNRAQVDFAREERGARQETTSELQQLASTFSRDRAITDTMKAVIAQVGFEAAGGFAKKGVTFDKGAPTLLATGVAAAIDGGVRRIAATTVETLTERVEQASTSLRALASSALVETLVRERQVAETSNLTNYNKSRTLTLLYHSVVDRFEVKTSLRGKREAIFVEAIPVEFDIQTAVANAHLLRPALIDPGLAPCFDAAARVLDCCGAAPPRPSSPSVTGFTLDLGIGGNAGAGDLALLVRRRDGTTSTFPLNHEGRYKANSTHTFNLGAGPRPPLGNQLMLDQITDVGLSYVGDLLDSRIEVATLAVRALVADRNPVVLFEGAIEHTFRKGSKLLFEAAGGGQSGPGVEDPCIADRCCAARLVRHLAANEAYYNGVLWMGEDPLARAIRFDRYQFGDGTLLDAVVNEPLAVFGRFLLFARSDSELAESDKIEQTAHITLPTPGVHIEAILGSLPAAERVDATLSTGFTLTPAPSISVATVQPSGAASITERLAATSFAATSALSLLSGTDPGALTALQAILTAITSASAITTPDAVGKLGELLKAVGDSLKDFKPESEEKEEKDAEPEPEEAEGNDGIPLPSDLA